jgi:glucose/arabinose dehydrogenase
MRRHTDSSRTGSAQRLNGAIALALALSTTAAHAQAVAAAQTAPPASTPSAAAPAGAAKPAAKAAVALPEPFATPSAVKVANVVGWPSGVTPKAPAGFRVKAFARGLDNPRNLLVLPNGDVLVAEARTAMTEARRKSLPPELVERFQRNNPKPSANRITLLRDTDRDGVADTQTVLVENLSQPYGMAIRRDRLYVANTDGVVSCPFFVGQTKIQGQCRPILDLPADGYNNHWTRNLVFSPDEQTMYVSVGSATNVDEERQDEKDPRRAAILTAKPDGSGMKIHATGLRNPVGLAFEPVTGRLWTTVNERDGLGDDLPPDYMTSVKAGAFYGWPFAYWGRNEDPRRKGERPDLVAKSVVPDVALGAHVAPLGLTFYRRDAFPAEYRGGAFVALRGSWNRATFNGYHVAFVPFANGRASGPPREFLSGFVKDAAAGEVHGRPAAVAQTRDGALLVADDAGDTVWFVQYEGAAAAPAR